MSSYQLAANNGHSLSVEVPSVELLWNGCRHAAGSQTEANGCSLWGSNFTLSSCPVLGIARLQPYHYISAQFELRSFLFQLGKSHHSRNFMHLDDYEVEIISVEPLYPWLVTLVFFKIFSVFLGILTRSRWKLSKT